MSTITHTQVLRPETANPAFATLHEITSPEGISWFPQTLGWSFLIFGLFCLILILVYKQINRYLADTYRRTALDVLSQLPEENEAIRKIPQLLKRTALNAYSREQVAAKTGYDWECWLDEKCKYTEFSTQLSGVLHALSYSEKLELSPSQIIDLKNEVELWIKFHERSHDRV
jgi:hypothetical protein